MQAVENRQWWTLTWAAVRFNLMPSHLTSEITIHLAMPAGLELCNAMVNEYKEVALTIDRFIISNLNVVHTKLYDLCLYSDVYDAPLEFRTRTVIQCDKLLYIVKGKLVPGYACVLLLAISQTCIIGSCRAVKIMHTPIGVPVVSLGEDLDNRTK